MKTIKITLVAVIVAAIGVAAYFLMKPGPTPPSESGPQMPEGCDVKFAYDYVESNFTDVPMEDFCALKQRRMHMQDLFKNEMKDFAKQCQDNVQLKLLYEYQNRFLQMTNKEFEEKVWRHFDAIDEMTTSLLKEMQQGSTALKDVEKTCMSYKKLRAFNARVKRQSSQIPTSLSSTWNLGEANQIISSVPTFAAPVSHTALYADTRVEKVKKRLYEGHVAFLDSLFAMAYRSIPEVPTQSQWINAYQGPTAQLELFQQNAAKTYQANADAVKNVAKRLNGQSANHKNAVQ